MAGIGSLRVHHHPYGIGHAQEVKLNTVSQLTESNHVWDSGTWSQTWKGGIRIVRPSLVTLFFCLGQMTNLTHPRYGSDEEQRTAHDDS